MSTTTCAFMEKYQASTHNICFCGEASCFTRQFEAIFFHENYSSKMCQYILMDKFEGNFVPKTHF